MIEDHVRKSFWCHVSGIGTLIYILLSCWTFVIVAGWTFVPGTIAFHPKAELVAAEDFCGAWATVFAARLSCVLGFLFFFPNLATVARWLSDKLVNSPIWGELLLSNAEKVDRSMMGLPITQVLVKAFLLRGTSDVASAQLSVTLHDKQQLEKDRKEAQ